MLERYNKKRKFEHTPEPKGLKTEEESNSLRFVVQKHQASRLHYDFRLEMDGVLKSWAVPKGPSLNPEDKRLAVMVEDHPFDYRNFEGVIPPGNYGAGTVMIWDEGTYEPIQLSITDYQLSKAEQERLLLEDLEKGHITFILKGSKLRGEFALIKIKNSKDENAWLLVKANKDEYAGGFDILKNDISVQSGQNLEEITKGALASGNYWTGNSEKLIKVKEELGGIGKEKFPHDIKPMKATLIEKPFDDKNWAFEVKWDGYRAISEINAGEVKIYSRNGLSFNEKFPEIVNALKSFNEVAIFDGEIVSLDDMGRPSFQLLQDHLLRRQNKIIYYVFDLLYFAGHDLTRLPWLARREILKKILPELPNVLLSEEIDEKGIEFFAAAKESNLEGIIGKKIDSTYQIGKRSHDWVKIKNIVEQEFVIGGYTSPKGARSGFGALLLGVYENSNLKYVSNVGTGFSEELIASLLARFEPLKINQSPFDDYDSASGVTWLKPELVCQVKFQEWTNDNGLRQPVFLGLREDADAKNVTREKPNG